jgi:hypothetical protein
MNLDIRPALALILAASIPPQSFTPDPTPERTGCTAEARRETLAAMQKQVLAAVPTKLESLKQALAPGGPLEGWNLSHGTVVLESAGAVAIDNVENRRPEDPRPPLLLYEPSSSSSPEEWLDFEGPDDPYRLVGWAYFGPYTPGSQPPEMACITPEEWLVHEAGWHLKDGGMHLTPSEGPRDPHVASADLGPARVARRIRCADRGVCESECTPWWQAAARWRVLPPGGRPQIPARASSLAHHARTSIDGGRRSVCRTTQ